MSKLGVHITTGSRNGYGLVAAARPMVVLAVDQGGALTEVSAPTIRIFRDTSIYGDGPNGLDQADEAGARALADQFYPQLRAKWRQNPADYYQPTNEIGGNDPAALRNLVAFEMRLLQLAAADNIKLCVGSFAGGSPGNFELWKQLCVPLILAAWKGGSIYGRHAYGPGMLTNADGSASDGNSGRPFVEAAYLQNLGKSGGIVITEAGQNAGFHFPGVNEFMVDAERYDFLMQRYPSIIGCCFFTYGNFAEANIEDASERLADYLRLHPIQAWQPPAVTPVVPPRVPPGSEPVTKVVTTATVNLRPTPRLNSSTLVVLPASRELEKVGEVQGDLFNGQSKWIQVAAYLHKSLVADVLPAKVSVRTTNAVNLRTAPRLDEQTKLVVLEEGRELEKVDDVQGDSFAGENRWVQVACYLHSQFVTSTLPPTDFRFTHWPSTIKTITQPFGVNCHIYCPLGLPGHEGLDIAAPLGSSIFAVADGTVSKVEPADDKNHPYGIFVRVRHAAGYETTYGHLQRALVAVGDQVQGGQVIGLADNTGNIISGNSHLHLTLKHDDAIPGGPTYIGYPNKIVDPTPFAKAVLTNTIPPSPIGNKVDLLEYMKGDGRLYEVQMRPEGSQARHQTQTSNGHFFHTKGENTAEWEELWATSHFIMRGSDTSPGNGEYYTLFDGDQPGSKWAARFMAVGETFERNPLVVHARKGDCQEVKRGTVRSWLKLVAVHSSFQFFTGITLSDVVELAWLQTPTGPVLETYFYAKSFGLVGWKSSNGRESAISEIHQPGDRPNNEREVIACLP